MKLLAILKILGALLSLFSLSLLPPMLVALWYQESSITSFASAFALIVGLGLLLWLPLRHTREEVKLRDGFIIVALFWVSLGLTGATPFMLSQALQLSFTDAVFEALSGLTTTGATIIVGLDDLPRSILFYRQQLQWLGGMGIIVLAVAILPVLGIGGMQLYRAEIPGPMKGAKLTPRITETAKALWYVYLALTVVCCLAYWLAGMSFFDAVGHSFSTVSIGGFSTRDASFGYFDSFWIKSIAVFFMAVSGVNFTLHFFAWRNRGLKHYLQDTEFKAYLAILVMISLISFVYLVATMPHQAGFTGLFIDSFFQSISITTTTGFTTRDYQAWPGFLMMLLLYASFIGACVGSTGGGIKVMRILLLFRQGVREVKRLVHPHGIFMVKLNRTPVSEEVLSGIWGFFAVYIVIFIGLLLILLTTGLDVITAFSAVAACLNNLGPGLGEVSAHYAEISDPAKWILCLAMLMGRLEIFTLLVLLSPMFWRR